MGRIYDSPVSFAPEHWGTRVAVSLPGAPRNAARKADDLRIRAVLAGPVEASGTSRTCWSILQAASDAGYSSVLHTPFLRSGGAAGFPVSTVVPAMLGRRLPYAAQRSYAQMALRRQVLSSAGTGDIAYLWPGVALGTFEAVARRGIPIVTEAVNTRMAEAKEILDAAYDALGAAPDHGITRTRIEMQEARNALCAAIFVPSPVVEASYRGTGYSDRLIATSFGTWIPPLPAVRLPARDPGRPTRFLFVGRDDVRKGLHHLLDAWRSPPPNAELRIVGEISPLIRRLYADVLDQRSVSAAGFQSDVAGEYRNADVAVLPSLEEGDPIATYEAAAHGLPVIASIPGAGRIGAETGVIDIVNPGNVEELRAKLASYVSNEEFRRDRGAQSRRAALGYDWALVAPRRFKRLFEVLAR